jgi:hypothetical protein
MGLLTRSTLKNLFKRGNVPNEVNFSDLIDSTVNKVDDGFALSTTEGWMLSPQGQDQRLMSFYDSIRDPYSALNISVNPNRHSKGVSLNTYDKEKDDGKTYTSVLFLRDNGNIGIHTTIPRYRLEVKGMVGSEGRVGIYKTGEVPADGRWHPILEDLQGLKAYEIFAQAVGRKGRGRYAMTQAVAIGMYGKGTIEGIKASYGWFFQKIKFRWCGNVDGYRLEICTAGNYGFTDEQNRQPATIRYYISKLWDDAMLPYGATGTEQE